MGVMRCDRNACDNIMCDRMIDNHYICYDCFCEFEKWIKDSDLNFIHSEKEWIQLFHQFRETEKLPGSDDLMSFDEFIKKNNFDI